MIPGHFIIMSFRMQPLFHSSILVYLVCLSIAQPPDFDLYSCETESGNYTVNGTYHINLNKLLSSLSRNTNEYGFYNATEGQNSDRVEAMVLCRGDLDLETCRSCIDNSTTRLTQLCPNNKEAIGWYSGCFLWYTNKSIVGDIVSTNPAFHMWNINNVSGVDQFKRQLINLLDRLRIQAVAGDKRKVAAGHTTWPDFGYMFALTQCTPVLSQQECSDCLMAIINQFGQYCRGKQGCRALQPSCNARFETYPFFKDIPPSTTPGKDDNTTRTVIIIAITTVTFFVVINVSICIFMRKKKQRKHVQSVEKHAKRRHRMKENVWGNDAVYEESLELPILDYDNIVVATNNFSRTDKLGEGGFGPVYKGKLQDGQEVAVKRLSSHSGQGAEEFKNEVILISKLQHRNLVKLLGCCVDGEEKLLVYEYMVNRSLDRILFDPKKRVQLDWDRRFNIIQGIARGLLYLHRDSCLRVIHRDLKASNILLDADMNPKISDFGLARTFQVTQEMANTHKVMGTFGYMSPEYAMRGLFSEKSDVFSFGVLLLEIISGTRNTSSHFGEEYVHLLGYAWKLWNERRALELVDKELAKSCPESKVMRCIHIGLLCVQDLSMERPSMSTVVFMLSNETDIPQPKQPVYESQSLFDAYPRSLCNNICSINDVSISNIEGR